MKNERKEELTQTAMNAMKQGKPVLITYKDTKGEETNRSVLIEAVKAKSFSGICSLRFGHRSFLFASVVSMQIDHEYDEKVIEEFAI